MKNIKIYFSCTALLLSIGACSGTRFPASNEEKAEYLHEQRHNVDEPTFNDETFDRKSGKGGGHEPIPVKKRR